MTPHVMDEDRRKAITEAAERLAALLLEIEVWRAHWRVEIDGCVFKLKLEGYPKWGTPRWRKRQDEIEQSVREFEQEQG